jgi:hypothetical protein
MVSCANCKLFCQHSVSNTIPAGCSFQSNSVVEFRGDSAAAVLPADAAAAADAVIGRLPARQLHRPQQLLCQPPALTTSLLLLPCRTAPLLLLLLLLLLQASHTQQGATQSHRGFRYVDVQIAVDTHLLTCKSLTYLYCAPKQHRLLQDMQQALGAAAVQLQASEQLTA